MLHLRNLDSLRLLLLLQLLLYVEKQEKGNKWKTSWKLRTSSIKYND